VKRTVSLLVLTIFLMHFIGFYAYFVVRQGQIRQEMRASIGYLPAEEFETFVFSIQEYEKIRVNDHEVKIDGRMYDHSAPKFKDGMVTLFARHDEAEDNLISFLSEVVNTASNDNKPIPSQLLNFFSLTFITGALITLHQLPPVNNLFYHSSEKISPNYFPVESPPPKG